MKIFEICAIFFAILVIYGLAHPTKDQNQVFNQLNCGKRSVATGNVYGGEQIRVNSFPWLVAFIHRDKRTRKYFCGGSLVSPKHVVSGEKLLFKTKVKNLNLFIISPVFYPFSAFKLHTVFRTKGDQQLKHHRT